MDAIEKMILLDKLKRDLNYWKYEQLNLQHLMPLKMEVNFRREKILIDEELKEKCKK